MLRSARLDRDIHAPEGAPPTAQSQPAVHQKVHRHVEGLSAPPTSSRKLEKRGPVILPSARKHGISADALPYADRQRIRVFDFDELTMS